MGTKNEMDELFDKAIQLEKRGEWEQAISLYEQAIDKWGNQPEAVYAKNCAAHIREMQKTSYQLPERCYNKRYFCFPRGIEVSTCLALMLLLFDVACNGSFLASLLICPFWFLFSILKNIIQRPGWRLALLRIAIPALILGLVFGNFEVQCRVAEANAARIIAACEEFHTATGEYPKTLNELVPRYMSSIPRAKYCLTGRFVYGNYGNPFLEWCFLSHLDRKIYAFKDHRWNYLD